jgi:hypothetical protein
MVIHLAISKDPTELKHPDASASIRRDHIPLSAWRLITFVPAFIDIPLFNVVSAKFD